MSRLEIQNGLIVTMDTRQRILENASIVVENDRIVDIADSSKEEESSNIDEVIDASGMVVLPGLVNCHVHAVQTLFRGVTDDLELLPWLQRYIYPMEAVMDSRCLHKLTYRIYRNDQIWNDNMCIYAVCQTC